MDGNRIVPYNSHRPEVKSHGSQNRKARKSAIRRYRILALIMGLLSGGLFACGIIAVSKYPEGGGGPPYYIGGFVVGILGLLHALLCTCIVVKGANFSDETKGGVSCAMNGQYCFSWLMVFGCVASCVLAGVGGLKRYEPSLTADLSKYNEGAVKTLSVIIIVGSVAMLLLDVFGMCIVLNNASYFGVELGSGNRNVVLRYNQGPDGTIVVTSQGTAGYNPGISSAIIGNTLGNMGGQPTAFSTGGAADVHSLQEQNRLLQEQVRLHQQLLNQQQQQQLLQAGQFSYGMPSQASGFAPSAPNAPPPSYHEVKY